MFGLAGNFQRRRESDLEQVLIIKIPSPSSSTKRHSEPYHFITSTASPNFTHQPIPLPNFTFQPFPSPFPTPLPPYKPIIVTLPNPTDRLQKRIFLCQMYILNQADEIFTDHNHFKYRQASQMIQKAIYNQLKQSSLQPYLDNVYVWYLYNSGPHLAVEFSIILLIPSRANIGLTTVKNVFNAIIPGIEEELNGTHIDRSSILITKDNDTITLSQMFIFFNCLNVLPKVTPKCDNNVLQQQPQHLKKIYF
ncbi:hypothetical protein DINM_003082 [Dirofilaria immitis]|nr:hypothetical protein [Dirofilaria immitis]